MSTAWEDVVPQLSEGSLAVVRDMGFQKMTPVQAATIPLFLSHKDVSVEACTGSGKTMAFLIPIFEMIYRRGKALSRYQLGALIISPTRELAKQIFKVAKKFQKHFLDISMQCLTGGKSHSEDIERYSRDGANIIIATPGRLEHLFKILSISVTDFEVLVLDEADKLLDMGFQSQINNILEKLPKQRRSGLFSATQSRELGDLIRAGLRNPARIEVQVKFKNVTQSTPKTLENHFVVVPEDEKLCFLIQFLRKNRKEKIFVFVLTCNCVDYFSKILKSVSGVKNILGIHGNMKQKTRTSTYDTFSELKHGVLICTDLAARGLDVPGVTKIVQYDPPQDQSFFVHRVGRTARMGRKGGALVMLLPQEVGYADVLRDMQVPISEVPAGEFACDAIIKKIRQLATSDRAILEKGVNAFTSFVRGYKEHHCRDIFILNRLKFGLLATGLGLVFMPKMPEIKKFNFDFKCEVEVSKIKFKDKNREKQRQINLKLKLENAEKEKKERTLKRKQREKATKEGNKRRQRMKRNKSQLNRAEWDELAKETALIKKLKKGKITQKQFDEML